ncbi:hypothetical protein GGR88_001446 [Sphingomonas jejuensis]|uniref:ThuA-like domain-containing protein n=1 Tax=Sphingomonas jejuensis TaxID=904715 RepID=A0ABX0XKT3_9SPHN|nr:ThuA domain-containing protein [Sphingomonas jejuensis]NJC33972.1 hypothetical protein [Sphingomonas jejuensis]
MAGTERLNLFVAAKGHAFERDPFEAMLRAIGMEPTMVDQPAAAQLMNPDALKLYDAVLLYDMPGMDFRAPREERPGLTPAPDALQRGFAALLESGKGIVALHHAIAGWPAWPAYAEALGGTFLYKPATVRGAERAGSRYVPHARYAVRRIGDHPVLAGVPDSFELDDEPYRFETFDESFVPLLERAEPLDGALFQSATDAIRRTGAETAPAVADDRRVIGWAKAAGNSPLVYLQPGDGPQTYAHPVFRTILGNALRWVASPEARAWAASA